MKKTIKTIWIGIALVILAAPSLPAQESSLGDWIADTGVHKIGGYVTLGLSATTIGMGLLGYPAHPYLGYVTAGSAAISATAGFLAYGELLPVVWPHAVLNGLAVVGFGLNAFVFEGGSPAHIATGITSTALLAASYITIKLIMR
jgi:hypothetical protein